MSETPIDNLDRRILHLLQVDARGATDTRIAEETDVTGTTIGNRIEKLEEIGIIRGYHPELDYEEAGYPLGVLFICSAEPSERSQVAERILDVRGVVNVREMLAGEENLHVKVVAESTSDVKDITDELDDAGLQIVSSDILAAETVQPWNHFHQEPPFSDIIYDETDEHASDDGDRTSTDAHGTSTADERPHDADDDGRTSPDDERASD